MQNSARLFAVAGVKQKHAEMFQALSGQLDNTGLEVACKAKTARNRGFQQFLLWIRRGKPLKMGSYGLERSEKAVFSGCECTPRPKPQGCMPYRGSEPIERHMLFQPLYVPLRCQDQRPGWKLEYFRPQVKNEAWDRPIMNCCTKNGSG
jgi:hypothetical protein